MSVKFYKEDPCLFCLFKQALEMRYILIAKQHIWRPPSISELTPMIFNTVLTHLGSKAAIYTNLIINFF